MESMDSKRMIRHMWGVAHMQIIITQLINFHLMHDNDKYFTKVKMRHMIKQVINKKLI